MLTALQLQQQRRRRPVPSLKQQYQEYILQRIESYKNSLSRRELLQLGNDAVSEMEAAQGDQFLLTEVLLTDWVDRLILRRLHLQPFRRWSKSFKQLRLAQREATHWGIERRCPVTRLCARLEPGDTALVIGTDAAKVAFLLAAHDVEVVFTGHDMTFVDQVESRLAEEALSHTCTTYVVPPGEFPPELPEQVHIVAIDTGALDRETTGRRGLILERLMKRTAAGGVHLILPGGQALAPEAYLSHYAEWVREDSTGDKRRPVRSLGVMLSKPPEDPPASASLPRDVSA
jgi:hypothetical protein